MQNCQLPSEPGTMQGYSNTDVPARLQAASTKQACKTAEQGCKTASSLASRPHCKLSTRSMSRCNGREHHREACYRVAVSPRRRIAVSRELTPCRRVAVSLCRRVAVALCRRVAGAHTTTHTEGLGYVTWGDRTRKSAFKRQARLQGCRAKPQRRELPDQHSASSQRCSCNDASLSPSR